MATVPHPVPSRTAHAIAALYGHDDDTLVAWQRACAEAAEALRPQPDEDRLRKALTLAQDGHVTLEDDGFATVESRGKHYQVQADGACACPDAQHRGATCKHALAVQIHYKVHLNKVHLNLAVFLGTKVPFRPTGRTYIYAE